jgi:hypothetical protein
LRIQTGEEEHALENTADETPPLVAAPRHLRRRAFHQDIPDVLLVPGVHPVPLAANRVGGVRRQAPTAIVRASAYQRKRLVALCAVVFVSLCIPALVIALILAG